MGESSVGDSGGGDGEHITHIGDMGVDIENRLRLALDAKVDEVGAQSDSSQIATNWNRYMYSRAYNKKKKSAIPSRSDPMYRTPTPYSYRYRYSFSYRDP